MTEQKAVQLFDENAGQVLAAQNDAASVARATQEIQAALTIAQRFPRDEVKVKAKILEACKRKDLAEVSEYEYSRGGTRITGPTIDLLRAVANRWGNMRFGWGEVERRDGQSLVRCFAWDMQTNAQAERTFSVKHWRDTREGGHELRDERDIYELLANMAARRVRACLEEVIDSDIVTAAVDRCRETLRTGEKTPLMDRAVQMVTFYMELGVTQAMLETRIGNKLEAISENQLASLRRVYKALKDGVGKREDYFKAEVNAAKPEFQRAANDSGSKVAAELAVDEQVEAAAGLAPVKPEAEPKGGQNYVKAVRGLCKLSTIHEGQLLDYLTATGSTDGSVGTLEELGLYGEGKLIKMLHDGWADIAARIKEAKK
jgi:hypothetical protein